MSSASLSQKSPRDFLTKILRNLGTPHREGSNHVSLTWRVMVYNVTVRVVLDLKAAWISPVIEDLAP
jgi:hypothetical protein